MFLGELRLQRVKPGGSVALFPCKKITLVNTEMMVVMNITKADTKYFRRDRKNSSNLK
jgi:hypothetical protein